MKLSYRTYNKLVTDKIELFSSYVSSYKRKYDFDYSAIISRLLVIHHGLMPTDMSHSTVDNAKSLDELFDKKYFLSNVTKRSFFNVIKSLLKFFLLHYNLILIPKKQITVFVHHIKFFNYVKSSKIFDSYQVTWVTFGGVVLSNKMLSGDKQIRYCNVNFNFSESFYITDYCEDLYRSFNSFIKRIKPSAVFVIEGDAPYHIAISNSCNALGIKNYCLQWGLIHKTAARTRFSSMDFTGFLTWGSFFTDQLKCYNPKQKFVEIGHLNFSFKNAEGDAIIFLDQGSSNPSIDQSHFQEYHEIILNFARNTDYKIIVRPHPNHDLCEVLRANLLQHDVEISNHKTSLSHDLSHSKVAVSIMSSSLLDALINGIIPVSFRYDQLEEYPFPLNQLKIGLESSCPSEIFNFINSIMRQPSLHEVHQKRLGQHAMNLFAQNSLKQKKQILTELLK
jgi:hypothetical protein